MENKERYHNATSIAPLVGLEPTTLGCWQPMLYQLSYQGKNVRWYTPNWGASNPPHLLLTPLIT